jgi:hypothetical protein
MLLQFIDDPKIERKSSLYFNLRDKDIACVCTTHYNWHA